MRVTRVRAATAALAALVALVGLATASSALGVTGRTGVPADNPPKEIAAIRAAGLVCRGDSTNFRAWWGETPGAPGALTAADASCATVPPVVLETLGAAEAIRQASNAAGFPPIVGDRALVFSRDRAWYRRTARLSPARRAIALTKLTPTNRGRLLAGLRPAERTIVLKRLRRALVTRLKRDIARAEAGRPSDFVGGNRRVDIMFDATGATGRVNATVAGVAPCSQSVAPSGRRTFFSGTFILFAPDAVVPRATLAHELFHTVQCILGVGGGTSMLLGEGTAEWHAATFEPGAFAGAEIQQGATTSVTGGAARAISFCNDFDPTDVAGLSGYRSFGVWSALELAAPGTVLGMLTASITTPFTTPQAVIAHVGDARWSDALMVAAREICGNVRTPTGQTVFPAGIRAFLGAGPEPAAAPAAPVSVPLAPGGVRSLRVDWRTVDPATTSVTIQIAATGVDPAAVAARTFVQIAGALVAATADASGATVVVPAAQLAAGGGVVTLANPSSVAPTSITLSVTPAV